MATQISTASRLEILETEINSEAFEAFYHIGQKLLQIKQDRLFEQAGFKSWSAYCASGRIDYGKSQANDYIRASEMRPKLTGIPVSFTVDQMLQLCKCETDTDAKRVAKKAISLAKKTGERVTAKLIKRVRDGDTGQAKRRRDAALAEASLEDHLVELAGVLGDWRTSLEQIDLEQWSEPRPAVLARVKDEARKLLEFLES